MRGSRLTRHAGSGHEPVARHVDKHKPDKNMAEEGLYTFKLGIGIAVFVLAVFALVAFGVTMSREAEAADNGSTNPSPEDLDVRNRLTVSGDSNFSGAITAGVIRQLSSSAPLTPGDMVVLGSDGVTLTTAPSIVTNVNVPTPVFYVNATTGIDAPQRGTDPSTPSRTIQFVLSLLGDYGQVDSAPSWSGTAWVVLQGSSYTFLNAEETIGVSLGGRTVNIISEMDMVQTKSFLVDTVHTHSPSEVTFYEAQAAITIDSDDVFVRANGSAAIPVSNGASTTGVQVASAIAGAVNGTEVKVYHPGFRLELPSTSLTISPGTGDTIGFQNMRIVPTAPTASLHFGEPSTPQGTVRLSAVDLRLSDGANHMLAHVHNSLDMVLSSIFVPSNELVFQAQSAPSTLTEVVIRGTTGGTLNVSGQAHVSIAHSILGSQGEPVQVIAQEAGARLSVQYCLGQTNGASAVLAAASGGSLDVQSCNIHGDVAPCFLLNSASARLSMTEVIGASIATLTNASKMMISALSSTSALSQANILSLQGACTVGWSDALPATVAAKNVSFLFGPAQAIPVLTAAPQTLNDAAGGSWLSISNS